MKRLFDIILSFSAIVLLSPVFAAIALIVRMGDNGPAFFAHQRIGRNFKPFNLYKFRTMVVDAPDTGPEITANDDRRITRTGAILRKWKLDELPQLWNVLKGDMSFVGPRPEVAGYVNHFREEFEEILRIRPGITDIASLVYSDEGKLLSSVEDPEDYYLSTVLPDKIRLAKEYMRRASFVFDIKLIILTLVKLICPGAVSSEFKVSI